MDLINDDLMDSIKQIVKYQVGTLASNVNSKDNNDVTLALSIVSNMLEYIDRDIFLQKKTDHWNSTNISNSTRRRMLQGNLTAMEAKNENVATNLNSMMGLVAMVRNATLYRLKST